MITTKLGDDGKSRFSGKIVDKDSDLLEAVGTLDELQAIVEDEDIQKDLSDIMAAIMFDKKVLEFKKQIVDLKKEFGSLNKFLIFKKPEARRLNWVRTVCRRAERRLVTLSRSQQIDPNILIYINRLSDYLFMKARGVETPLSAGGGHLPLKKGV